MTASALRTAEIRPPSARAETWMVARAVFHIVLWSALVVSAETHDPARAVAAASAGAAAKATAITAHTFLSFTNAILQTYAIERTLAALRPDLAPRFAANATAYTARLRRIRADAARRLAHAKIKRVVTVHDGYGYLCQELGVEIAGVVEPAHGLTPSAAELGDMVDLIKREKIRVVLTEETFPEKLLAVLKNSTNVDVFIITHIAAGAYAADEFEDAMTKNVDTLVKALAS